MTTLCLSNDYIIAEIELFSKAGYFELNAK